MKSSFFRKHPQDVADAITWYNQQAPGLGKAFLAEVNRQVRRISGFPESYPPFNLAARKTNMHRFSYAIVYRVQPSAIKVVAVFRYSTDRPS